MELFSTLPVKIKKFFSKNPSKPNQYASYLIASILVVYPEVSKVSYDPKQELLQLSFTINGYMSKDEFEKFAYSTTESIKTYHCIEGFDNARLEISIEGNSLNSFLSIYRDMTTLTRGELTVITSLVSDHLNDKLIVDVDPENIDEDLSYSQIDKLDQTLTNLRKKKISDRLIGIREDEKVIVYVK